MSSTEDTGEKAICIVVVVLVVYSYVIYQRYTFHSKEPLSLPFDTGDRA